MKCAVLTDTTLSVRLNMSNAATNPKLENAHFLARVAPRDEGRQTRIAAENAYNAGSAIDPSVERDDDGTNVVPNHHHGHRAGGGSPPVWYQGGTVRAASEVTPRA